tara:strand:- start:1407 stop:1601 length:195 start_codon:yes stop_codon:yes gene_type:complete
MRSEAEIKLQIGQLKESQQQRLQQLAANDPLFQKYQGAIDSLVAVLTDEAAESEGEGVLAESES